MSEPNQIRVILTLDGAGKFVTDAGAGAKAVENIGKASVAVDADLAAVIAQIKALGAAAAASTTQLHQTQAELAGLSTSASAASQKLRELQLQNASAGTETERTTGRVVALTSATSRLTGGIGAIGWGTLIVQGARAGIELDRVRDRLELVSGSSRGSGEGFRFASSEAERLGLGLHDTAVNYTDFIAATESSKLSLDKRRDVFSALNEAAARYNLTQQQTNQVIDVAGRVAERGKLTLDDLTGTIGKSLPQATDALARGLGVSREQLTQLLAKGIESDKALAGLAAGLRDTFDTSQVTRIESTTAEMNRLKNEILLLASAGENVLDPVIQRVTRGLGNFVGALNGGAFRDVTAENNAGKRAALGAFGDTLSQFGAGGRFGAPDNPSTFGDQFGTQKLDAQDQKRLESQRQRLAYLRAESETQRAIFDITQGELVNSSNLVKNARLAEAAEKDRQTAEQEAARLADEAMRQADQNAKATLRQQQEQRRQQDEARARVDELILGAQQRNEAAQQELATGLAMTEAERELLKLRSGEYDALFATAGVSKEQLRLELERAAALERQKVATEAATQAQNRADRERDRYLTRRQPSFSLRPGESDPDPLGRIGAVRGQLVGNENAEFQRQLKLEADYHAKSLDQTVDWHAREQELADAHAARLREIDTDYVHARLAIYASMSDGTAALLGNLADLAAAFGEKGFKAYKAFAIAQALIAIPGSAIKAYESTLAIPVIGPELAPIAAAVAVAAQLAQVAKIRAAQPPAREFGGDMRPNSLYGISEGGKPELVESSGRYYLASGAGGRVFPARSANGEGGSAPPAVNVNLSVTNNAGDRATVRTGQISREANGSLTMEMIVDAIDDNASPLAGALRRRGVRTAGRF